MTDAAPADPNKAAAVEEPSDDDESVEQVLQEDLDAELIDAAKANDLEGVVVALDKTANPQFKKDGWSPLLWAACNGNEDMVRILINRKAGEEYIKECKTTDNTEVAENAANYEEEEDDPFIPGMDASKHGKYTPLHWASYKGYYKVVWILLKN